MMDQTHPLASSSSGSALYPEERTNPTKQMAPAAFVMSAIFLWISFPFVSLSAKCFLTDQCFFHFNGSEYSHPLSAAALHMVVAASLLALLNQTMSLAPCRRREATATTTNQEEQTLSFQHLFSKCTLVGLCFGCKYVVGHAALQITPTPIYELFHCFNLVFVAAFAYVVLNERLQTCGEYLCIMGVVMGSGMAGYHGLQGGSNNTTTTWLSVGLNTLNGVLAGAVVVLLRRTMVQCHGHATRVTACKMWIGAACVLPVAFIVEPGAMFHLTRQQTLWLFISSAAILVYQSNLSILCYLATDASTVAIVESLRPILAFFLLSVLQRMTPKTASFWVGSIIVLISAVGFELPRKLLHTKKDFSARAVAKDKRKSFDSDCSETATEATSLSISSSESEATEITALLLLEESNSSVGG